MNVTNKFKDNWILGIKPYACHICHMKFRTSSARKSHLGTHTKPVKRIQAKSNINQMNRYLESLMTNDAASEAKMDGINPVLENVSLLILSRYLSLY